MNFSATSDYNKEDGHFIQHGLTMRNISKLAFQPSDEVLDVGCGTGNVTKYIAKQVKRVTGRDSIIFRHPYLPYFHLRYLGGQEAEGVQLIGTIYGEWPVRENTLLLLLLLLFYFICHNSTKQNTRQYTPRWARDNKSNYIL